jgi:hypothetical protein
VRDWLLRRARDAAHVKAARQRLVESGLPAGAVKALPALQIVLLDEKREYEARRDEQMKWRGVPFWRADQSPPARDRHGWLFAQLVPPAYHVFRSMARLDQRIALLRHVEAIRMYAAEHGKVPARLADLAVPLPVDPITGKPFAYRVEGGKAIVRGSPPRGQEKSAGFNVQYEVSIRK